jgi:hypothetical protein
MAIKNFWSLEPGEAMVADEMRQKLSGWEVYFPIKDVGVDLLAASGIGTSMGKLLTFQVKESKAYERRERDITPEDTVTGWFALNAAKTRGAASRVNFHVFVCSRYHFARTKRILTVDYLVVPTKELIRRLDCYHADTGPRWDLYLVVEQNGRCLDWRGIGRRNRGEEIGRPQRDYTQFLNNWQQVNSSAGI